MDGYSDVCAVPGHSRTLGSYQAQTKLTSQHGCRATFRIVALRNSHDLVCFQSRQTLLQSFDEDCQRRLQSWTVCSVRRFVGEHFEEELLSGSQVNYEGPSASHRSIMTLDALTFPPF